MITKQYKEALRILFSGCGGSIMDVTGSNITAAANIAYYNSGYCWITHYYALKTGAQTNNYTSGGIYLGDGTAAESEDDYKLAGNIITTISHSTTVSCSTDENGNGVTTAKITVTNTGSSDITISEIGAVTNFYYSTNTSVKKILADRTLLENPITLAPGEVGQITYTITTQNG